MEAFFVFLKRAGVFFFVKTRKTLIWTGLKPSAIILVIFLDFYFKLSYAGTFYSQEGFFGQVYVHLDSCVYILLTVNSDLVILYLLN